MDYTICRILFDVTIDKLNKFEGSKNKMRSK